MIIKEISASLIGHLPGSSLPHLIHVHLAPVIGGDIYSGSAALTALPENH